VRHADRPGINAKRRPRREFLDRLAWLPPFLADLDRPRRLDA
jgi:hypothetical protein